MNKDYIAMCEQAKELQKLRGSELWQEGDFITDRVFKDWENNKAPRCYFVHVDESDDPYEIYNPVWLPRQDQLQKMLIDKKEDKIYSILDLFKEFHNWYTNRYWVYVVRFNTAEEIWLAYVMFELFGKQWNMDGKEEVWS